MGDMNLLAIFTAAILSFIVGALWYSPVLFLKAWCQETGVDPASSATKPIKVYGLTFLLTLLSAFIVAFILGPKPELAYALCMSVLIGAGLVTTGMAINYQFANRSLIHWLIDSGFQVSRFIVMGLVLGLWH